MRARKLAAGGAVLACALTAPGAADAATLVNDGLGTLTYTSAEGTTARLDITSFNGFVEVRRVNGDADPIVPSGCTASSSLMTFYCAGVTLVLADAGDHNDVLNARNLLVRAVLSGGADADILSPGKVASTLEGGPGNDTLYGTELTPGLQPASPNTLDGGPGDDLLWPDEGDSAIGGPGIDVAYHRLSDTPVSVSLNGVADDGPPGAATNFATDIEDVHTPTSYQGPPAKCCGPVTLVGNSGPNRLSTEATDDHLDGGAGADILYSGGGNDTIVSRDGYADRIDCGSGGSDLVYADESDQVFSSCENVQWAALPYAADDRPPAVSWGSPISGARLPGSGSTVLSVNWADDHGVRTVRFLAGEREICLSATAPFTCVFRPRGEDVGRTTITVIATDAAGQTASAVRAVTVGKIAPRGLTLRVRRGVATGRLLLPEGVTRAEGCTGTVSVASRRTSLTRTCGFRVRVRRTATSARFLGNRVLSSVGAKR